jgi:hypothetical protein
MADSNTQDQLDEIQEDTTSMEEKLDAIDNIESTTQQVVKKVPNPTGKGGFKEHPELRNPGGWNPDYTFSYQYKRFLHMEADKFLAWDKDIPDSQKKVVEKIAWSAVFKARGDLRERQEVANRTEGMPKQAIDMTQSGGIEISFVDEKNGTDTS